MALPGPRDRRYAFSFDGVAMLVRFNWRRGAAPYWDQAFSADDGRTSETNWTMDFERARAH